jgi:predicted HicB family RNase H-like nuclease
MNKLAYKGYTAKIDFDPEEQELVGQIEGIRDLVVFSSKTCDDIEKIFHDSVDGYLESCQMAGKNPDKAYTGSFNIRIDPEDHRELDLLAKKEDTTLNSEVCSAVHYYLENKKKIHLREAFIDDVVKNSYRDYHELWVSLRPLIEFEQMKESGIASFVGNQEGKNDGSDSAKA